MDLRKEKPIPAPEEARGHLLGEHVPEIAAGVAVVLLVLVAVVRTDYRLALLAATLLVVAGGWVWTMREQARARAAAEAERQRMEGEYAQLEKLLDAALTAPGGRMVEVDLSAALREVASAIGADLAACYVLDNRAGVLVPVPGGVGVGPGTLHEYRVSRAEEAVAGVLTTAEPFVKQDGSGTAAPRLVPKGYGAGSTLLVPMVADAEVVGILALAAPQPEMFTDKDIELARATADQCAVGLVREQLLDQSRAALKRSTVIKEVALAVNSTLDLHHILQLFLGKARGVIDYDRAAVVLFDGAMYEVAALVDADTGVARRPAAARGALAGSVYDTVRAGILQVRHDLGEVDDYATESPGSVGLGQVYSEVLVPLRSKGEVAGCVAFRAPVGNGFPEATHPVLYELANLGGMAIANSIAHAGTQSQARHLDLLLGSLSDVSRMLTATTEGVDVLERRVAETVSTIFSSPAAVLTRVTSPTDDLAARPGDAQHRVAAAVGAAFGAGSTVVPGAGLIGAVTLQQQALRVEGSNATEMLPGAEEPAAGVTAGLCAPMFLDGEFHGAIAVFRGLPYDDSELAVLSTVANQVAVALRNADLFNRSQRTLWELTNLHEGLQVIASSLNLQAVLEAILNKAATVSRAQIGSIMLVEDGKLRVHATYGTDGPTATHLVLGIGEGIAGRVLASGEPILANDVSRNPDFFVPTHSGTLIPKALLCVPMRLGDEVIGVINLSNYLKTGVFEEDSVRLVTALASQTSIAVENARVYQHLRTERDRLITLEEQLRQDLARDLHDGPVQRLAGMAMNIEVVKNLMAKDEGRAREELDELEKLVRTTIREARTMLFELRPLVLETQGLPAALSSYGEQFEANTGLAVEMEFDETVGRLPPAVEQTLFSVVQEAMGNIRKHARASSVTVELLSEEDHIVARVRDDGRGFDVEATQASYATRDSQSLGLVNMVERAERIGGKFQIESTPGTGTTVTVTLPRRMLELRPASETRAG